MQDELDKTLAQEADEQVNEGADAPTDERVDATAELPDTPDGARPQDADEAATQPMPHVTTPLPEAIPAPEPSEARPPTINVDAPSLADVGSTLAAWVKSRAGAIPAFLGSHRLVALLVAGVCVVALLGGVLWGMRTSHMPSDEQVSADAISHLGAPSHTMGSFDLDEPLVLQSVDIASKRPSGSRRDACTVGVVATFTNAGMETRADGELTYVREGDDWTCTAATIGSASHHATSGVSQSLILAHLDELLQTAEPDDDGRSSLSSLYREASCEVTDVFFDEESQTCEYALHLTSTGTFVAYECDLLASFRFAAASGAWELTSVAASKGAKDLGLSPLQGTWRGTFVSQSAGEGRCLAARDAGLEVTITQATMSDDGEARIVGTVSGIAHLHADLSDDANETNGDLPLAETPFEGTSDGEGLVFNCQTQDVAGGTVTLTLTFGTSSAPDEATAMLTSAYAYDDTLLLFIPYRRTAHFADTFTLEKV